MTQEEKARAYDEALERAQKATRAGSDVAMDIVQYIFPQLAESEDERIRKALVWHLKADVDFVSNGVTKAECLAYLEKQKPAEVDESTKRLNDNWMKQYFDDYKERKPAEWSEEDEEMIKMILGDLEWERRNTTVDKDIRLYDEKIAWLKSLKPHWKPSEVQLNYLLILADYFESEGGTSNAKSLRELYENLKKL